MVAQLAERVLVILLISGGKIDKDKDIMSYKIIEIIFGIFFIALILGFILFLAEIVKAVSLTKG